MSKDDLQATIGRRVKTARKCMGLKQEDLAEILGLKDRQSISEIENGKRALKPQELVTLSDALDKDIEYFIDPFSVIGEAKFSWRASNALRNEELAGFENKASKWIGLLRWLRKSQSLSSNILDYTPRITRTPSFEDASLCAEELVRDFNLGEIPSQKLQSFIEQKLDIPVMFVDTLDTYDVHYISGASCHLNGLSVIMVNRNEPESRRNFDLAHELFHILTWNHMEPAHRESNVSINGEKPRVEKLADIFASSLLMPKASIDKLLDKSKLNEIHHLLEVSTKFKVSPIALGWRLYNLGLLEKESVYRLQEESQNHGLIPKLFSLNFVNMLYSSIKNGNLSARKASKAMSMSLDQLKDLFKEYSLECPFDL